MSIASRIRARLARGRVVVAFLPALAVLTGCAGRPATGTTPAQPPPAEQLLEHALFLAASGDDFAAEQYLSAALSAGHPPDRVARELVRVCVQGGRLERALSHARSYVERHPEDWIFHHVVATIEFAKGDAPAARSEVEYVLAEHPEHAESHFLRGIILRDEYADMRGARRALERYLTLAPDGEHASEVRAWVRRSTLMAQGSKAKGGAR